MSDCSGTLQKSRDGKGVELLTNITSSSAIAEEPHDALSQLKSCQLLHNCTKNHNRLEGLPFHVV